MRRFLRILFNALTVLSLGLAVLAAALWVRSKYRSDELSRYTGHRESLEPCSRSITVDSGDSCLSLINSARDELEQESEEASWYEYQELEPSAPPEIMLTFRRSSFRWLALGWPAVPGGTRAFQLILPHWFILSLLLLPPAGWLGSSFHQRRRPLNACPTCNYDLRASPDRCPECGTVRVAG